MNNCLENKHFKGILSYMATTMELNIPEYFSIADYKKITHLEHLSDKERMITTLSILTDKEDKELRKLKLNTLEGIFSAVTQRLVDLQPNFHPIIEIDGILYGFQPLSKFTLGEYVDLEQLLKDTEGNLEQIMAILYRPITKHKFNSIKWMWKWGYKIAQDKAENLFRYYDVEEYDNKKRGDEAEILANIPASFALGALSFFLLLASQSISDFQPSFQVSNEEKKMKKTMTNAIRSMNIGDGLARFIRYRQVTSFPLMETKVL